MIHLSAGSLETAKTHCARIQDDKSGFFMALQASFYFLEMQFDSANKLYRKALAAIRRQHLGDAHGHDLLAISHHE